jgi:hypothetical protein
MTDKTVDADIFLMIEEFDEYAELSEDEAYIREYYASEYEY